MTIEKILVADDELLIRNFLAESLRRKGFDVVAVENGQKAIAAVKESTFDLVITDMKMPDITGLDVLRKVKECSPTTLVIVITAFGSVENAVEAMQAGAFNYLLKPFTVDMIEMIIEKAQGHISLVNENVYLRQQISGGNRSANLKVIGESPAMKKILDEVARIAKSNASVFISGESGTGKEVVAQAIHQHSLRADHPFIKVNCAAIPETLIESEFFGHEKGAFTGAHAKHLGRFELANGGSLLLDEITEIPLSIQAKLLRVTQEQEFERIGGTKPIHVDVRLISTSNRDIKDAITKQVLREDLYYRLNVIPVHLPPLRERKEDIIPLAAHFLESLCHENHKAPKQLTKEAEEKLLNYEWPGNIRELANVIERAIVMDTGEQITPDLLYIEQGEIAYPPSSTEAPPQQAQPHLPIGKTLGELEKMFIIETLHAQNNNRTKTAQQLGISVRTLRNKLNEYNIK